jgi:uncharacterized protein
MTVEHHDLIHDFPELRKEIHTLKVENNHFRKLFDQYHKLTKEIENMENEVATVTNVVEETAKKQRVILKDELYGMLVKESLSAN